MRRAAWGILGLASTNGSAPASAPARQSRASARGGPSARPSLWRLASGAARAAATAMAAAAAERGGDIRYEGGPGPVLFRHSAHDTVAIRCSTCHTRLFPFRRGAAFGHADMRAGRACGACHDGAQAFGTEAEGGCEACHAR